MEAIIDDEGENQAVRCFLMLYGRPGLTTAKMRRHLAACGYPLWPDWVASEEEQTPLTKAGAQLWLRHLFSLEKPKGRMVFEPVSAEEYNDVGA